MPTYKIYRQHGCTSRHRSYKTMATCIWKRAAWIVGNGPYATLAHCGVLTVTLHPTGEAAEVSKRTIDDTACGHQCSGRHEIVELALP